jgi:hypothetical protein
VPAGLIGMLAVVGVVETAVSRAGPALEDTVCFSWTHAARAAVEKGPGRDVLCLGDSLAKHGLMPRVIEQATGRPAYNLAAAASPAPVAYFVLKRAINAGARPRAVVFDLKPSLLAGGPKYQLRQWQGALTWPECFELIRAGAGSQVARALTLGKLLPTFRARHEARAWVLSTFRCEPCFLEAVNAVCEANWSANLGANVATPNPAFDGTVSEAQHAEYLSDRFSAHEVNALFARRLLRLAASAGVRRYLVLTPLAPELHARRVASGADAAYTRFVAGLQAFDHGLTVLDARGSGYPPSAFVDPTHLDARGAAALSAGVAAALQDGQVGGWVRLPGYGGAALPEGTEDVEKTRRRIGVVVPARRG